MCEDLSLKCEQLTKRNSRLIGQIGSDADVKEEPTEKVSRSDSEFEIELVGMGVTAGFIGSLFGNPAQVTLIRMCADGKLYLVVYYYLLLH